MKRAEAFDTNGGYPRFLFAFVLCTFFDSQIVSACRWGTHEVMQRNISGDRISQVYYSPVALPSDRQADRVRRVQSCTETSHRTLHRKLT